tara:strand:+ start:1320 stop:1646 length:327 start_codon:yes stop_codon:yes gene_type:complete
MTDLSPEHIEAIPNHEYLKIKEIAGQLHEGTVGALDSLGPQDLNQQEELRTAIALKLESAQAELGKGIADMRALKKDLEIMESYARADKARILSRKISIYKQMKDGNA